MKPTLRTNVGRRLEILTAVLRHEAEQGDGLGVIDAADAIGREKSQVSRGLRYLAAAELAQRDDDTLKFETGASLLRAASRGGDPALLRTAFAVLEELAATTDERAHLSVLCGHEVLTVATVSPSSSLQAVGWVGRTTPAHCTASGEALLSDHDADALRALLGPDPLPAAGPAAPGALDELVRRISVVREQLVSVVDGGLEADLVAVAAPIRDPAGHITAAVNVSGPGFRMRPQLQDAATAVRRAVEEMQLTAAQP